MASLRHHEFTLARPRGMMTAALLGIFLGLSSPLGFAQDDILGDLEKKKAQEKQAAAVDPAGGEKPVATTSQGSTDTGEAADQQQPSGKAQQADG
ncbi:MAG: hypothetical protein GY888_30245, partial [Planctomycetaceae bacterium]|nr:hypothetical protein [Planctomycetaceae bacterium]